MDAEIDWAKPSGGPISRRDLLRAAGLGLAAGLGAGIPASAAFGGPSPGRARSCLWITLGGGASHLDTFDPKPDAPAGVRGEFRAIATAVPGISLSEHLPRLARLAHSFALIRSVGHDADDHDAATYLMRTGRPYPGPACRAGAASRDDDPDLGSALAAALGHEPTPGGLPFSVAVRDHAPGLGGAGAGRHAGILGQRFDPLVCRPGPAPQGIDGAIARALDVDAEPARSRDRYGPGRFGRSVLAGRRLVEAGVRFVRVDWPRDGGPGWDAHADGFRSLAEDLLPPADRALAALLDDLRAGGRLDEPLVVVATEFGRSPRVNALGGRDHWPRCYSALVARAGVAGGRVLGGGSDRLGGEPLDRLVTPGELTAGVVAALGVDPSAALAGRCGPPPPGLPGHPPA